MAVLPKVNSSGLSKRLFFQKKAFNFSFGGDTRGLFEDWVEEERGDMRPEETQVTPSPALCVFSFFLFFFFFFFLFTSLIIFGWLLCAGCLLFTDSCFEHQSDQVICQAVCLWSYRSEASGLSASKYLTSGDLPPSG